MSRITVRFPGLPTAGLFSSVSTPGPLDQGSFLTGTFTGGQLIQATNLASFRNSEFSAQRVPVSAFKNGLPLTAVAISPDSAIHGATISLGGSQSEANSFRCTPGNPVFVEPGTGVIWVNSVAGIPVLSPFDDGLAWDATVVNSAQSTSDFKGWAFPLRLLLIYGDVPQMAEVRAPYHGYIRVTNPAAVTLNMYFCIDGRNEVEIIGSVTGSGVTSAMAVSPMFSQTNDTFPAEDRIASALGSGNSINLPASGQALATKLRDAAGVQGEFRAPIVKVSIAGGAAATRADIKIIAWD